ncbi:hypothetical protein BsWGS_04306 [Bradybaena similaris]
MNCKLLIGRWTYMIIFLFINFVDMTQLVALEPSFDSPMANVTFKEMETAILPCSVKFLGRHQVVWTDQWSTLLTYEDRRIIDDERLSVERPFTKDWNLHIRDVKYKDQGLYNCQINTNPVKIKTVNLKVQVPSRILNNASTDALVSREGTTVTLVCNVSGIPMPSVTWHRLVANEKGEDKKKIGINGEILLIHNVSRYCGGVYECVAYNGVPPAVNKLIRVSVEFPPEVKLPNKRMGQEVGKETILECVVTANPQAVGIWKKNGEEIKTVSGKYRIEPYAEDDHSISLSLRIMFIDKEDYGFYTCEASNKLGRDNDTMALHEYLLPRRLPVETTITTTATSESTTLYQLHHRLQFNNNAERTASSSVVHDQLTVPKRPNNMHVVNNHGNSRAAASSDPNNGIKLSANLTFSITLVVVCILHSITSWPHDRL